MPATTTSMSKHSRLFVQRFKTEPCRTFECEGKCPYEDRCMFAHGASDLRSEEMNLADGLVNDSAVRKWQRHHRAAANAAALSSDASSGSVSTDDLHAALAAEQQQLERKTGGDVTSLVSCESRLWYRHNPYGCYDIFVVKPVRA